MVAFAMSAPASAQKPFEPIDVGSQRQILVDRHLIESMDGVRLELIESLVRDPAEPLGVPVEPGEF